jgi:hypothetical protein
MGGVGGDIRLHTAPGTPAYNLGRRDRGPQSAEGIKRERKKRGIRKKKERKNVSFLFHQVLLTTESPKQYFANCP